MTMNNDNKLITLENGITIETLPNGRKIYRIDCGSMSPENSIAFLRSFEANIKGKNVT